MLIYDMYNIYGTTL